MKYEVYAFWRRRPVDPKVVFYESFGGNGMLCNPEAIFRALKDDPEFAGLRHVWALTSKQGNPAAMSEFARDSTVRFVRPGTTGYYRALATSGYLINNATFPPEFGKRTGQVYLNTWHGTPLKRMGFDIGDPASRVGNVIRNFLNADFLLAANRFMVEQMYEEAHRLRQLYRGRIIEEGYPRIDRQFLSESEKDATRQRLGASGLDIGDRRIILYAPTWKGTNFNRPEDDARELIERVVELNSLIDTERYVVLLKTHQVVHAFAAHLPQIRRFLVPNEVPTNLVLGITDVLVTDYSSIFFDFLATGRPIAFLVPDIGDYSGYRGLYLTPDDWPGPVTETVAELAGELRTIDESGMKPDVLRRYENARERFVAHEDGNATARVIDIVFRGNMAGYRIAPATRDDRKSVLINAGGMRPNGITTSLLNLLDAVDYTALDVSVIFPTSYNPLVLDKQRQLNPRVRQFSRTGGMNGSKVNRLRRSIAFRRGDLRAHQANAMQRQLWDDEWTRCFGASLFDYVIDFSGYGPFAATLLLHAPWAERSIWLHNDLAADAHRVTRGRRRHLRDLNAIFSLYRDYDHLVSVSPSLNQINAANLGRYAERSKFTSAPNLVNEERILSQAALDLDGVAGDPSTGAVPTWATDLDQESPVTTFVTVGRLSPEKNHARLLRAFALVHARDSQTRLLIIGSGPLRERLEALVEQLGLTDSVRLLGHQSNPYAVMAHCDCFVLSSDYEGQPMVLLEALVLQLPVVTVAFGSVRDTLPEGAGLVVPPEVESLADGMAAFLSEGVSATRFDATSYNQKGVAAFARAVGLDGGTPSIR